MRWMRLRLMRWVGVLAVTIGATVGMAAGLVGATQGPACACSCVQSDVSEHFKRADAVFTGNLVSRDGKLGGSGKATLVFEVASVYKGKVAARQEIVTHESGATCGLELTGPGKFLVFANADASDYEPEPAEGQYVGSLCGGSQPLDAAVEAELRPIARATKPVAAKPDSEQPDSVPPDATKPDTVPTSSAEEPAPAGWWLAAAAGGTLALAGATGAGIAWRRRKSADSQS
jgi:hypothetical protein